MVADVGFKKQLWALDPQLDVVWNPAKKLWEIWRFPGQERKPKKTFNSKSRHMMTVQTEKRTFRELGADILLTLQKNDPWRYSYKQLCDYFDTMEDNMQRAREKHWKNLFHDMYADGFDYLHSIKKSVPFSYEVKPSEKKYLIKTKQKGVNRYVLELPKKRKMINAIAGVS